MPGTHSGLTFVILNYLMLTIGKSRDIKDINFDHLEDEIKRIKTEKDENIVDHLNKIFE